MNRSKLFAVLAGAMTILGVLSPAYPADLLVSSNFTTRGNEAVSCFGGAGGCPGAVAGCTFADCSVTHSLDEIVDLVNFRLVAGSPAIGAGAASLVHGGFERVPVDDFDGDPRPDLPDLPAIGFDEGP